MSHLIPAPQPSGGEFLLYQSEDGRTKLDVRLVEHTVWLSQKQLTELFGKAKGTISEYIKHIFEDQELEEASVVRFYRTTAADGKAYEVAHYNLDLVLALGFRVKSRCSTGSWQPPTFRLRARSCPSTFNQLGTTSWPRIKTSPKR